MENRIGNRAIAELIGIVVALLIVALSHHPNQKLIIHQAFLAFLLTTGLLNLLFYVRQCEGMEQDD